MPSTLNVTSSDDIERAWEQWHEHLLAQFSRLLDGNRAVQLFLLVDSRATPGVEKLLQQVPRLAWVSLWRDSVIESYTDIAPYLFQIDHIALSDPGDLLTRLVRRLWKDAHNLHMLTWIWSPLSLELLSTHLRYYSRYETTERRAFFLHFYDNRILERLRSVWTEAEGQVFVSPCVEVWYRDRDWNDVVWRNEVDAALPVYRSEQFLTAEQHLELLRLGRADKLAMQLRDMYGGEFGDVLDSKLYYSISEQLERAGKYRIADKDDLLNYVVKGVMVSPRFDEHPEIHERLMRAASGEITLREALCDIDSRVLAEASKMVRLAKSPDTEVSRT
ncbi:DUF4123 domain-containing protein [Paraburkholderia sp.]|uniref:DUF4123 domain-containing protein n=1 Tax=Paraburkholderia sp. TaxID=1926495 RepID=UPI0025CC0F72|nr:DUF4123 domain-containing protein [Paraburkholderia sp.]